MYIKHVNSKIQRPLKELKGFKRVFVEAGKKATVTIPLNADDLKYWNTKNQQFELEKETIQLQIGSASNNIKITKKIKIN